MKIIDISLPVHEGMPTYPGDPTVTYEPIVKPSGTRLTQVTLGSHTGTHIDAPSHSLADGEGIGRFPLMAFYGPVRVVVVDSPMITKEDCEKLSIGSGERVLFKTNNSARGYDQFYDSWVGLSSEAANYLADIGVVLVGIDWFGIKQKGAADNAAHTALLSRGIAILEGVDLSMVAAGSYTLAAFPVAWNSLDGAPCRAVLIADE